MGNLEIRIVAVCVSHLPYRLHTITDQENLAFHKLTLREAHVARSAPLEKFWAFSNPSSKSVTGICALRPLRTCTIPPKSLRFAHILPKKSKNCGASRTHRISDLRFAHPHHTSKTLALRAHTYSPKHCGASRTHRISDLRFAHPHHTSKILTGLGRSRTLAHTPQKIVALCAHTGRYL